VSLLGEAGRVLRLAVTVVSVAILVGVLLVFLDVAFDALGLIDRIATALVGGGALGWYGVFAGLTMLALTGTKVWSTVEFAAGRLRQDDLLPALTDIVGRGIVRGVPAIVQIFLGGLVWPVTLLGWYGKHSDERGRERLRDVREFHALRQEIHEAREAETPPAPEPRPGDSNTPLRDRHDTRPRIR